MNLKTQTRTTRALLCAALFFLAFSIRWYGIEESGNQNDEQLWYYRAAHLMNDILSPFEITGVKLPFEAYDVPWVRTGEGKPYPFDINQRSRHPGTPPTFLMGLSYFFVAKGTNDWSLNLLPLRVAMRLPAVIIGSLLPVFLFLLGRKLWGDAIALLSAILYVAEPFTVGLGRLARIDLSESFFILVALLTYAIGQRDQRPRLRILSGILIGIGLAHRPYSFLIIPILLVWKIVSSHLNTSERTPGNRPIPARLLGRAFERMRPPNRSWALLIPLSIICISVALDILWVHRVSLPMAKTIVAEAYNGDSFTKLNTFFSDKAANQTLKPLDHYVDKLAARWPRHAPKLAFASLLPVLFAFFALRFRVYWNILIRYSDRTDRIALVMACGTFLFWFPNLWGNPVSGILHQAGIVASLPHIAGEASSRMPTSPLIYLVYWVLHLSPILTIGLLIGMGCISIEAWRTSFGSIKSWRWTSENRHLLLCAIWILLILGSLSLSLGRKDMKNLSFVVPAMCILGAFGLIRIGTAVRERFGYRAAMGILCVVGVGITAQNFYLLHKWYPYYQLYTLDVAGDPQSWNRRELVGGGEGLKEAAEYLASLGAENDVVACATGFNNLSYFHKGEALQHYMENILAADWLILQPKTTYCLRRDHEIIQFVSNLKPEKVFMHNQIEMARIYRLKDSRRSASKLSERPIHQD